MGDYSLQADEAVLYRGSVTVPTEKGSAELLLTNINVVVSTASKKSLFSKPETNVIIYPIKDIKIYDGEPQIKQKGYDVEIYFKNRELVVCFASKIELSKFKMAATKLLTGKSVQARGADKVKRTLNLIDDTLGVDVAGTVKGVLENGVVGSVLGGAGKKKRAAATAAKTELVNNALTIVSDHIKKDPPEQATMSHGKQLTAIKEFKELLDIGVISEEEFAAKKKEILGL